MPKLTRKNLIIISSGIALCLVAFIIIFALVNNGKQDNIGAVNITVDGGVVSEYEIYCGGKSVQFGYSTSKDVSVQAVFSITGDEDYDCTLTSDGLFTTANKSGVISVSVSVTLGSDTKTASIDVTVRPRGLTNISATVTPHTEYVEGQKFNPEGLVVEATFENGDAEAIADYIIENNDKQLTPEDTNIIINYAEGEVTKTTLIPITVAAKTLESIVATASKTTYIEGEIISDADFTVTAQYEYLEAVVDNFTLSKTTRLTTQDTQVTVSYTENGVTKETVILITVVPKTLQSIEVSVQPERTSYIEGEIFDTEGLSITKNYEYLRDAATGWMVDKTEQLMPNDTAITVSYTENGIIKTVDIAIVVAPRTLQSIEVTTPPETISFIEGQTFDVSGLILTAHYEFKDLTVTDYSVDTTTKLLPTDTSVTISYTENGVIKQTTIGITVAAKILQSIEITSLPAKTSYIEGQSFIPDGLSVKAVYEYVEMPVSTYTITVADILLLGDEEVLISFTDGAVTKTATIDMTIVRRTLQSLSISTSPTKSSYIEGESFDNAGLVLTANYEHLSESITAYSTDKTEPLMPTDAQISFSFTYHGVTKTVSQNIVVAQRTLQSISVSRIPNTNAYIEGQTFNKAGLEITAHYEYKSLVVTGWTVDETTPLSYDATFVVVTYTENYVTKIVNVFVEIADNLLDHINIISPANKLSYSSGERLSTVGLVLRAYYTNGTNRIVAGFVSDKQDPLAVTDILVTISYTEASRTSQVTKSATYGITVIERVLDNIEITSQPNKLSYIEGELFNNAGLAITAHYSGGMSQVVTNYILSKAAGLSVNDTQIIVFYTENTITKQATININVAERLLTELEIAVQPAKTEYKTGEKFVASGLVIRAVYNNGAYYRTITSYTIDKNNFLLSVADEFVVISYIENGITKTVNIPITVTARDLTNIIITSPASKLDYTEGEYLDILGLTITAEYSNAPNAIITNWTVDKTDALTLLDTIVTITYTESGVTKTVSYNISIAPLQAVDTQVLAVITAINSLPSVERLALGDKAAIVYAGELFTALTVAQKEQITNTAKLLALLDKMIELEAAVTPEPENEYSISYQIYGDLSFSDVDFDGENYPEIYRNSMGEISLNSVISVIAEAQGYEFIKWVDESGDTVTSITDLNADKTYYAVFQLTATVNIEFHDYSYKGSILLTLNDTTREEFNLLVNNTDNNIFVNSAKLCMAYYVVDINGSLIQVANNKFNTDYNSTIIVYVVTAEYRQVNISPKNDFLLSYVYEYLDDSNEAISVNKSFNSGTQFLLPVSANVTITLINPMITNILLDGVGVGLTYPQIEYTFKLSAGLQDLEITFTYYVAESILLTFSGLTTRIYSYSSQGWDGKLSAADLNDILFIFDEENDYYLNRYIIDGVTYFYTDLADFTFTANITITVDRVANEFELSFVYTGGEYKIEYLVGKQTVGEALNGQASKISFIDDIFTNLIIYSDILRETEITQAELFNLSLLDNMILYVEARTTWTLTINNKGEDILVEILSDENFDLLNELPNLNKQGFTFKGYSLTENGSILTPAQILVIVANLNTPTTIFAVYEAIEGYEPPDDVDYSNELFAGEWTSTHNNGSGIIDSLIILNIDGIYEYETKINGVSSVKLTGEYRLNNGNILIKSLVMEGDYQLINKSDLILNIEWVRDNILIATCFIRDSMAINSYLHYLTRGQIRSANYNGIDILGEYVMRLDSLANGTLSEQSTIFTFYANGTITATMRVLINGEEVSLLSETALFRITSDNKIWVISNGSLGTMDITDILQKTFVKSGQDYSAIAVGSFIATNEKDNSFASLIVIYVNGEISFTDNAGVIRTINLNIQNASEYACFLQTDILYTINIEVVNSGDSIIIILNENQVLYYNRID